MNRDLNASLNIRLKGYHILHNIAEPEYRIEKEYDMKGQGQGQG